MSYGISNLFRARLPSSFFPGFSGCHFQALFLALDADGAVMRNLVFMFGSLEKAKLQEGKATLEMAGKKEMWENI